MALKNRENFYSYNFCRGKDIVTEVRKTKKVLFQTSGKIRAFKKTFFV